MANPPIPPALRREVRERAKNCCEYCRNQERYSTATFSVEHILPSSKGGTNDRHNLAFACWACNAHKSAKLRGLDPIARQFVPLFNPRNQAWEAHFIWDGTFTRILGITPTGRATVNALNLNREESVNLRAALVALGKHPPL